MLVFPTAVFQNKLGETNNWDEAELLFLFCLPVLRRSQAHPAVGIRIAFGKIIHGVQSQKAWRGSHQILPRVAFVLKGKHRRDAARAQTDAPRTQRRQRPLTENPNFLNSLAQRERRLSLLGLLSLSNSNASWRKQ